MDCTEVRHHWNLYHDSEGDARLHFEIEEHLAGCPECAEWFAKQSRLETLLAEKLRSVPSEAGLWDRVLVNASVKRRQFSQRWLWMAGVAACAATVLLAVIGFNVFRSKASVDLARQSAAWHERLSSGHEPVEFASRSDADVEDYLRGRVSFPVRCPPRKDAGFAVRGAGIGRLEGFDAAYLSGEVGSAPVSIFVLPRDCLAAFPDLQKAMRERVVHQSQTGSYATVWREFDRNAIVVVGRTDPEALVRVVNAYGSYPDHH